MKDHSKRRHLRSLIEETKVDFCLMQEMNCERMEESFVCGVVVNFRVLPSLFGVRFHGCLRVNSSLDT